MDFILTRDEIVSEKYKELLQDKSCGAIVIFEGVVRNHNDGKSVTYLEYSSYDELAVSSGNLIIASALKNFAVQNIIAVHRVGTVQIGECALWVGVEACHRQEAFAACEYVIKQIKKAVPIWKNEYYLCGSSEWVVAAKDYDSCQRESYFKRQIALEQQSNYSQNELQMARVAVVGAGGLGCPVIANLSCAGVGTISVFESDTVDVSNLHRQHIYKLEDVGRNKSEVVEEWVHARTKYVNFKSINIRIDEKNIGEYLKDYDFIVDCSDNFETKFLLNDFAVNFGKCLISASVQNWDGYLFFYQPGYPCLRCLWKKDLFDGCAGNNNENGILGVLPLILGSFQANVVINAIQQNFIKPGVIQVYNGRTNEIDYFKIASSEGCCTCDMKSSEPGALSFNSYYDIKDYIIVDVRSAEERDNSLSLVANSLWYPKSKWDKISVLDGNERYLLVCQNGVRSKFLAQQIRETGKHNFFYLNGGMSALFCK